MTSVFRFVLIFLFLFSFGCAYKPAPAPSLPPLPPKEAVLPSPPALLPEVVLDVPQLVSQAVQVSDTLLVPPADQAALCKRTLDRFFAPWRISAASVPREEAFWGTRAFASKQGYAENLQPYPAERWARVVALQNMASYPSLARPAIVTRNTSLRALPSLRPFFLDPTRPGEGFPFDYFQSSALWLGTPVLITHLSSDRAWSFVETAFVSGWVRSEDLAQADPAFRAAYESRDMAALRLDDTPLLGAGRYLGQAHIGALFPLHGRTAQGLSVRVPVRDANGQAIWQLAELNLLQAAPLPLPLTSRAVATLADAMSGQLYGWGGLFENRDCSATMRDLFLPFGLWLPRNSAPQAKAGALVPLAGLSPENKVAAIRSQGQPFVSLIAMPGHIGLYLGTDARGEPLMLHSIWGARTELPTGGTGRAIIGRLAISTLRPAEERPDVRKGAFLDRIQSLTIVTRPAR